MEWNRVMDMNDRTLREITVGLGGPTQGLPREDGFNITVASEIMTILCLATGLSDLKERLSQIEHTCYYSWGSICKHRSWL